MSEPALRATYMCNEGVVHVTTYRRHTDDYVVRCYMHAAVSKVYASQMTPTCLVCVAALDRRD